jgi:hypothetical protein
MFTEGDRQYLYAKDIAFYYGRGNKSIMLFR